MENNTQEWDLYQQGITYNNNLNYYAKTDLHWNFYNSEQWKGIVTNGLSKWTFNICKSAINYFISFIMSQKVKLQYSAENLPDEPTTPEEGKLKEFVTMLSNMADMKWEKDKMDSKIRALMLDGSVTGDFCAHVYWDDKKETGQDEKGDFCTEVVDGVNVMFGNPNNKNVEAQPYILILGREMVSVLKAEAKENKIDKTDIESIVADSDTNYQAGSLGKVELESKNDTGKCNYIIKYWKENGEVFWNKSTKACSIVKGRKLGRLKGEKVEETKITRYPVAWGNWETIKNSYHGMSLIKGIIDNQISINHMFAMISYWMRMSAFGKTIYDGIKIPEWNNALGTAIKVEAADGPISNYVHQLQAGNFNAAILTVIELAIKYTKDFIGANDALLGQINPEQASGTAIITTTNQATIPLNGPMASRDQFIEDLGLIWGEFYIKKYRNRKVSYREKEKVTTGQYSTEGIDDILLQCKVDVGPSAFKSEIIGIQNLESLRKDGAINNLQYFERMAKMNVIPDVQGLIEDAKKEIEAQQQQMAQQQQGMMQQQGQEQMMQEKQMQEQQAIEQHELEQIMAFVDSLPPEAQERIKAMGDKAIEFSQRLMKMSEDKQAKAIMEMMQ